MERLPPERDPLKSSDEPTKALLQLPLFQGLGRLDLARLAGELTECGFAAGETIFQQGDAPDALYIIRFGSVLVFSEDAPSSSANLATLGPGEILGELGLISNAPRSASAVACGCVATWSLSRDRFLALLDIERSIAVSLERTLAARLRDTSKDLLEYQEQTNGAVRWALGRPKARSRGLMTTLSLLPSWDFAAVNKHCDRTGFANELQELIDAGVLHRSLQNRLVVASPLRWQGGELPSRIDRVWLGKLAAELAEAESTADAIDLLILLGDAGEARKVLESSWSTLRSRVSPAKANIWQEKLSTMGISLDAAVVTEPAPRLDDSRAFPMLVAQADQAPARAEAVRVKPLDLPGKKLIGLSLAITLYGIGWSLPPPDQLERGALVALFTVAASIPLLTLDVFPLLAVAALLILGMVIPEAVGPDLVLSGFSSPAFMMIISLFAVSDAVGRSGLGFRVALAAHRRLPPRFLVHSLLISGVGALLTAVVSSGSARMMMAAPAVREISNLLGFPKQSKESAALGLITYFSFSNLSALFVTGSVSVLLVFHLLPESSQQDISWIHWFLVALVPMGLLYALTYLSILAIFRPRVSNAPDKSTAEIQRDILGQVTKGEVISAVVLAALGLGFATKDLHSIGIAWVALAALVVMVVARLVTASTFSKGIPWPTMLYTGVLLGLGTLFRELNLDAWLAANATRLPEVLFKNPYGFVLALGTASWVLAFILPVRVLAPVMALIAMPIAEASGFSMLAPVLVILIAGNHAFLPKLDTQYLNFYFAVDCEMFTHQQVRRVLQIVAVLRLIVVLAAVPYFQFLGLM